MTDKKAGPTRGLDEGTIGAREPLPQQVCAGSHRVPAAGDATSASCRARCISLMVSEASESSKSSSAFQSMRFSVRDNDASGPCSQVSGRLDHRYSTAACAP